MFSLSCRLAKEVRLRADIKGLPSSMPANNAPLIRRIKAAAQAFRAVVSHSGRLGHRQLSK